MAHLKEFIQCLKPFNVPPNKKMDDILTILNHMVEPKTDNDNWISEVVILVLYANPNLMNAKNKTLRDFCLGLKPETLRLPSFIIEEIKASLEQNSKALLKHKK